jgi:hypothetical protein
MLRVHVASNIWQRQQLFQIYTTNEIRGWNYLVLESKLPGCGKEIWRAASPDVAHLSEAVPVLQLDRLGIAAKYGLNGRYRESWRSGSVSIRGIRDLKIVKLSASAGDPLIHRSLPV